MAYLAFYGSTSPEVFEEMDPGDTLAFYEALKVLVEGEQRFELERTKALMRASGARIQ